MTREFMEYNMPRAFFFPIFCFAACLVPLETICRTDSLAALCFLSYFAMPEPVVRAQLKEGRVTHAVEQGKNKVG